MGNTCSNDDGASSYSSSSRRRSKAALGASRRSAKGVKPPRHQKTPHHQQQQQQHARRHRQQQSDCHQGASGVKTSSSSSNGAGARRTDSTAGGTSAPPPPRPTIPPTINPFSDAPLEGQLTQPSPSIATTRVVVVNMIRADASHDDDSDSSIIDQMPPAATCRFPPRSDDEAEEREGEAFRSSSPAQFDTVVIGPAATRHPPVRVLTSDSGATVSDNGNATGSSNVTTSSSTTTTKSAAMRDRIALVYGEGEPEALPSVPEGDLGHGNNDDALSLVQSLSSMASRAPSCIALGRRDTTSTTRSGAAPPSGHPSHANGLRQFSTTRLHVNSPSGATSLRRGRGSTPSTHLQYRTSGRSFLTGSSAFFGTRGATGDGASTHGDAMTTHGSLASTTHNHLLGSRLEIPPSPSSSATMVDGRDNDA